MLLNAHIHFGQWVIGNALRELTGGFANFLDRIFEALLIIKYHGRRAAPAELQQQMRTAIEDLKLFGKIERIETNFGVTAKFKSCFPSISLARDALAFNLGKVRDRDCNADKTLRLSWIGLKSENREKIFKAGEQIDLSTYELSEICWTFAKQADELVEQMMLSAQFKGLGRPQPETKA